MEQSVVPSKNTQVNEGRSPGPRKQGGAASAMNRTLALSLRTRSIIYGIVAAAILTGLIAIGSRGFHWFDAALIGYAVATIFAVAAVTYKYTFWLARPPTWRYWIRSWQLFFSYQNFLHYTALIPRAILDLFAQQFIRRRGLYRWITHQCIFWGVILSCLIAHHLTRHIDKTPATYLTDGRCSAPHLTGHRH